MPANLQAHVQHAPAVTADVARWEDDGGAPALPIAGEEEWLRISAALSERLPELADREDVLVTCEYPTRSGAPGAFFPELAELEIDLNVFGRLRPATIKPERVGDEDRYPAAWGVLCHEAAHAAHSRWRFPASCHGTAQQAAGELLEESRAECVYLARRPGDRRYLRASVHRLIMQDISVSTPSDPWHAAMAAALTLARRDSGVLEPDEVKQVESIVTTVLGADKLRALAAIWTAAHASGDEDAQAMLEHARAWCETLGADPSQPEPAPDPACPRGELAEAIGQVAAVSGNEEAKAQPEAATSSAGAQRRKTKADKAHRIAQEIFTPGSDRHARSPITGTRPPTKNEKAAVAALARTLRAAAYRERVTTHVTSVAPPGRLVMRQALVRDAQRAAGALPTAAPWKQAVHRHTPAPPLRVGIAIDVSSSMKKAAAPIASAAWIIANAAARTGPDSRTATVAFDGALTAITAPGRKPKQVTQFTANGRGHRLADAIDALNAGVGLTTPGAGRLLVIASDGYYLRPGREAAAQRIAELADSGCAVLWLAFAPKAAPLPGAVYLELTDPADAVTAIGKAATRAVATATR